jgi:hypothetical protein
MIETKPKNEGVMKRSKLINEIMSGVRKTCLMIDEDNAFLAMVNSFISIYELYGNYYAVMPQREEGHEKEDYEDISPADVHDTTTV